MGLKGNTLTILAVKKAEYGEGIIIRLNNLTDKAILDEMSFMNEVSEVWLTDMGEEKLEKLEVEKCSVEIEVAPFKINTYLVLLR